MMNFWKRLFAPLRTHPMTTSVAEAPPSKRRNEATGNADLSGSTNYDLTKSTNSNVSSAEPAIIRPPEKPCEDVRSSEKPIGNAPWEPSPRGDTGPILDAPVVHHADRNVQATKTPENTAKSRTVASEFERWAAEQDAREKAEQLTSDDADDEKDGASGDPDDDSSYGTLGLEMSMIPSTRHVDGVPHASLTMDSTVQDEQTGFLTEDEQIAPNADLRADFERSARAYFAKEMADNHQTVSATDRLIGESPSEGLEMSMAPQRGDGGRRLLRDALHNNDIILIQALALEEKIKVMEKKGFESAEIEERTKENIRGIRRYSKASIWASYSEAIKPQEALKSNEKDKGPSMGM